MGKSNRIQSNNRRKPVSGEHFSHGPTIRDLRFEPLRMQGLLVLSLQLTDASICCKISPWREASLTHRASIKMHDWCGRKWQNASWHATVTAYKWRNKRRKC